MQKKFVLTDQESMLRQLLLDVSAYVGTIDGQKQPELRFTGGWVRDKLLGSSSVDIDIGIDTMTGYNFGVLMKQYLAQPESSIKYKQDMLGSLARIEANPEKSKHLETVTTRILGLDIDLVNLRKEVYEENSRTPLMEFGSPEEDALRRDATVNALFYNLTTSKVEDLTGRGLEDMERKLIKTPLAPLQTFRDDPLRVLRAIRFASRLGYNIAAEDEEAMSNHSIKNALKLKISRERIGVEIIKMLKGPNPHAALSLLDRLGLYDDVFTNPAESNREMINTTQWSKAYDQLLEIVRSKSEERTKPSLSKSIGKILLRTPEDEFLAWVVACFVPWAKQSSDYSDKPTSKKPPSAASIAAREGIKADNKITKAIDDAVVFLPEIVSTKNSVINDFLITPSTLKRKLDTADRVNQGLAIRRWGPRWRLSVIFAILSEVGDSQTDTDRHQVLEGYASWLLDLQSLNLLDADQIKPLVHGNQLIKALGAQSGPWVKKALEMTIEWQLRNPDQKDVAGAIAEVVERKKELGVT